MLDCLDWKICFPSFKILKVESPALDYVITTFFLPTRKYFQQHQRAAFNQSLEKWNSSKVKNMGGAFFRVASLKSKPSWYK